MEMKHKMVKAWETKAGLKAIVLLYEIPEQIKFHCGYVVIPENSVFYNKNYNDDIEGFDNVFNKNLQCKRTYNLFEVHGGITMSGYLRDDINKEINENLYAGEDQSTLRWLYGYDCNHISDLAVKDMDFGGTWKDADYCVSECESLAEQIITLEEKHLGLV